MSDPNYNAVPPGGYSSDPGVCDACGGIMGGMIGFPGEYPCHCPVEWTKQDAEDAYVDAKIEEYMLARKGAK